MDAPPEPDYPEQVARTVHCDGAALSLRAGQKLKILSWNVQYMAGKNHVFFYDVPGFSGPDERPLPEEVREILVEVARIIGDENPDIVLLQEVDDGSKRTDYLDELGALRSRSQRRPPGHLPRGAVHQS